MKPARSPLDQFLSANRALSADLDYGAFVDVFQEEMTAGLQGRPSSLPMIPTYIETEREIPAGQRVLALDAGGTNLRAAVVSFDASGSPVVEDLSRHRMPGIEREVSREDFFATLAGAILPLARRADRIGFCFSYPAEIQPDKDGRLVQFTKEIKAKGVEGQLIGAGLAQALQTLGAPRPSRIVLVNDTVTTLLAARNGEKGRRFSAYVGLVCGTGLNSAYVESNKAISKLRGPDPAGAMVVNMESGSFARGPVGADVDGGFDATTANPSRYRHEKMISGAYLGALCLFAVRRAAADGLLSSAAGPALERLPSLSTQELDQFLRTPDDRGHPLGAACASLPDTDAVLVYRVCDALVERAASMVAVTLAAVVLKTGAGQDPRYPVRIAADGTTFWQLRSFRDRVDCRMRALLSGGRERAYEIASVTDAPLLGAAIAALTN